MKKLITVSGEVHDMLATMKDSVRRYIGHQLGFLVGEHYFGWEDVAVFSTDDLVDVLLKTDRYHSMEELEADAGNRGYYFESCEFVTEHNRVTRWLAMQLENAYDTDYIEDMNDVIDAENEAAEILATKYNGADYEYLKRYAAELSKKAYEALEDNL